MLSTNIRSRMERMCVNCGEGPKVRWNLCEKCINKGRDLMDGKVKAR